MATIERTARTTLKRLPQRGSHDQETIYRILDEGLICHVGFAIEGQPFVIPTIHVRVGDRVCLHGSPGSRMGQALARGFPFCLTVTLVDVLVLARSAFHHSMNYQSVVILGKAAEVADPAEKMNILHTLTNHLVPGRWEDARQPNESEIKKTLV